MSSTPTSVLVLGGGPDAERQVSIDSATGVHQGCLDAGLRAELLIVDEPSVQEIDAWNADVIFPVLHGRFGEGGELQRRLEQTARPFVGCKAHAAHIAMDKMATKLLASTLSIPTKHAVLLDPASIRNPKEALQPILTPLVIKPVADGSSCGLFICDDQESWMDAVTAISRTPDAPMSMIEPKIQGQELTVGVIDDGCGNLRALPIIQISPAAGTYDYQAKYERSDTEYTVNPELADDLVSDLQDWSLSLCTEIGVRHLARVDFMLDESGNPWLLEANTMPGFTASSLLPKAAASVGLAMPDLCKHLVDTALRTHEPVSS